MQSYFAKFNIERKSLDESGCFAGYASMFNVVDFVGDIILPGAFKSTIEEKRPIKLLWQHDNTQPIGIITKITEDTKGLYIEGKIMLELAKGKEAFDLMSLGIIDSLSIGFQVEDFFYHNSIRYIKKLKLWEISIVTFPANIKAKITKVYNSSLKKLSQALDRGIRALRGDL